MVAIPSANHITSLLYVLETLGMLYGSDAYQITGLEATDITPGNEYIPSRGFPVGLQRVQQVTQGRLYPEFLEMWRKMSADDVYGPEPTSRYMLNYFKVLLQDGTAPPMTDASFKDEEPWFFSLFLIDAAYTFVFALNSLLNQGVPPEEIYGTKLLEEVKKTTFEGVTGEVSFNSFGDRHTDSALWNVQLDSNGQLKNGSVAIWKAGSTSFTSLPNENLTWARGIVSPDAPEQLTACPAGQYWDSTARLCLQCEQNTYSTGEDGKAERCRQCGPGEISLNTSGAIGCKKCEPGTFRINQPDCMACPRGTYGASEGQSTCQDCDVGKYASREGMQECEVCGAGFATQSLFKTMAWVEVDGIVEYYYLSGAEQEDDCGCDRGTRRDANDECVGCGEGMICKGMNDVTIAEGYYAGPIVDGGLSVFRCHGNSMRCQGGLPGQTCAEGREGLTCGECKDSMTPAENGKCNDCGGGDTGPFVVVVIGSAMMLCLMYHVVDTQNRAKSNHALVLAGTSVGMLMTTIQLLAVLGSVPIEYEDPLRSFMDSFSFDLDIVRINCVSKQSPLSRYIIKLVMLLIIVCFLVIMHVLVVVFYYGRASGWRLHSLIAGVGSLFMVFYITVTSTVLEPLQCQDHPNTRWTVLSYPSVLCWERGEHQAMLILGIITFVLVPLIFMVACILAVRQFPWRMSTGDVAFLKAFSFLFVRLRASRHTFVLNQMARSFAVAMVLVIPSVAVQLFVLQGILLASYTTSLALRPWRVQEANYIDCLQGALSVLVVSLASMFLQEERSDLRATAWVALFFIIASITFTCCGVGLGLFRKYLFRRKQFQYFLCHHKAGAGAYTRLLKMQLQAHPKVVADVFLDSDNLDNLDCLFNYVGNDTSMLVVVCSAEIFSRPWCLGEMCTARLHIVPVCRIALPSMRLPGEDFITHLETTLEGLEALTENGIDVEMVQTTLHWMQETPIFHVPNVVIPEALAETVGRLISSQWVDVDIAPTGGPSRPIRAHMVLPNLPEPDRIFCALLFDTCNLEAEATASIFKKLLTPLMAHRSKMVPEPWRSGDLPDGLAAIVVLCSNGIFDNDDLLRLFNRRFQGTLLPVLAEPTFRFPGKDVADVRYRQRTKISLSDAHVIAAFVHSLFKEIAVTFDAQHAGEAELKLAACRASVRLLGAVPKDSAGSAGSSPAPILQDDESSSWESLDV